MERNYIINYIIARIEKCEADLRELEFCKENAFERGMLKGIISQSEMILGMLDPELKVK